MNLFAPLLDPESVPHAVLVITAVAALGLALGQLKVRGLGLGIAGVLFSGLLFGHLGVTLNEHVLEFTREFGLILFVYAIGLQVGPGFFSSLKKEGLPLNLLAASVVLGGVAMAGIAHRWGGLDLPATVGVLAGATTNTPSLGAAQQALRDIAGPESELVKTPGMGYAVAYPFGVIGIILVMVVLRTVFRIRPEKELEAFAQAKKQNAPGLQAINLEVTNVNLAGIPIGRMPGSPQSTVVISRVRHGGRVSIARPDMTLDVGDVILAVGPKDKLEDLRLIVGRVSEVDLRDVPSDIATRRVLVTRKSVLGQTIDSLEFPRRFGVTITRLSRMEIEFAAHPDLRLKFGDTVLVVGEADALRQAAEELGNSPKQLNDPQIVPLLVGIALGVVLGSLPLAVPGLPAPVRLGLAGGPLVMAILLARLGRIGRLVWHMPISANFMIRELGISLFLACVGVKSGGKFVETLLSGPGVGWVLWGAAITGVPLLVVGIVARLILKTNYTALCGLLAGAMTDPPALAFANAHFGSEAPALSYATVYPLTMLLRVLSTQAMVLLLMR